MRRQSLDRIEVGIADLTIAEVGPLIPDFFALPFAVIGMLDSSNVTDYEDWITQRTPKARCLGNVIVVPGGNDILTLIRDEDIFYNFDELYLCPTIPKAPSISRHFTSDRANFGREVPSEFLALFHDLGAIRYLADGCGLNFACESQELVGKLGVAEKTVNRGYSLLGAQTNPPSP